MHLHCAINAWRLLDWVFSVVRTHVFYLTVWFQRERFEALLAVNFMELIFFPWSWRRRSWKLRSVEEQWWSELDGKVELAWGFVTSNSDLFVGATREVQSSIFRGENPRSGLNWLCVTMFLLKALFWERGLSSGWILKIYDRATTAFVHCLLLGGVAYEEADLLVLSWWCQCCCFKFSISVAVLFFFCIFSFFLAVWILYAVWAWCCCRGWVYWYLRDINKYPLSKKLAVLCMLLLITIIVVKVWSSWHRG
jgi:hypothetical protein